MLSITHCVLDLKVLPIDCIDKTLQPLVPPELLVESILDENTNGQLRNVPQLHALFLVEKDLLLQLRQLGGLDVVPQVLYLLVLGLNQLGQVVDLPFHLQQVEWSLLDEVLPEKVLRLSIDIFGRRVKLRSKSAVNASLDL